MPKKVAELIAVSKITKTLPSIEKMMEKPNAAEINGERLDKILKILENNTQEAQEIKESVKFIKHYFLWQSVYNTIKIVLLLSIVVLGVISWRSIVDSLLSIYG